MHSANFLVGISIFVGGGEVKTNIKVEGSTSPLRSHLVENANECYVIYEFKQILKSVFENLVNY